MGGQAAQAMRCVALTARLGAAAATAAPAAPTPPVAAVPPPVAEAAATPAAMPPDAAEAAAAMPSTVRVEVEQRAGPFVMRHPASVLDGRIVVLRLRHEAAPPSLVAAPRGDGAGGARLVAVSSSVPGLEAAPAAAAAAVADDAHGAAASAGPEVAGGGPPEAPWVRWQGEAFRAYGRGDDGWLDVLLPVPLQAHPVRLPLELHHGAGVAAFVLPVEPATYPESRLRVDPKFTSPPPPRAATERAAISASMQRGAVGRTWQQAFTRPVPGVQTSPFGVRRTFNGQLKGRHLGEDFDGRPGDPVRAANDGVVVLAAEDFFYVGNAAFVDHGDHLYTMYFHMTQLQVHTGEQVRRGQQLGTLGATGRVTGPHVHFAVKYAGTYLDPRSLLDYVP